MAEWIRDNWVWIVAGATLLVLVAWRVWRWIRSPSAVTPVFDSARAEREASRIEAHKKEIAESLAKEKKRIEKEWKDLEDEWRNRYQ